MRTICDGCGSAPAIIFCAADEAALCTSCDHEVHMCNKLASRHVRVGLGNPSQVPHCDICENAPAFFYCEIDGTSLCLQCDMIVHVGGKRSHGRYLLLRQRIQFPDDKQGNTKDATMQSKNQADARNDQNCVANKPMIHENFSYANGDVSEKIDAKMIDLNTIPYRNLGQASVSRSVDVDHLGGSDNG